MEQTSEKLYNISKGDELRDMGSFKSYMDFAKKNIKNMFLK